MTDTSPMEHARAAAREALGNGPLTIEELATLLLATHLSGASGAAHAVAGLSADQARSFAAELDRESNEVIDNGEAS